METNSQEPSGTAAALVDEQTLLLAFKDLLCNLLWCTKMESVTEKNTGQDFDSTSRIHF